MICQKCHQNEATVYISQTINQETTQMHLCAQCASDLGPSIHVGPLNLHPFGDFGDFLNDIVQQAQQMGEQIAKNMQLDPSLAAQNPFAAEIRASRKPPVPSQMQGAPGQAPAPSPVPSGPALQCPHCGYQFDTFRQTGRLGCTRCYGAFQQVLQPLIASIHGNVEHVEGGTPVKSADVADAGTPEPDKLSELKAKLKEAVKRERFEEAARLRDDIHALEGKNRGV